MKIYYSSKGSMLIILIITLTIISVLGSAILSITTTSLFSKLSFNNFNKAVYYAESGTRYVELTDSSEWYFDDEKYFTAFENSETKKLEIVQDTDDPSNPTTIDTAGFHIGITNCAIESTGSVIENSPFETKNKITTSNLRGLPFWKFNNEVTDMTLIDSCGKNKGKVEGPGISYNSSGKVNGAWKFDGPSYVKTLFRPYCEIGDGVSFSISFWVKPDNDSKQTVFGVIGDDDTNTGVATSLTVGISATNNKWEWSYGGQSWQSQSPVKPGEWQHIIIIFDNDDISGEKVYFKFQNCDKVFSEPPEMDNNGTAKLPYTYKHLYIGTNNLNGDPDKDSYFSGEIDELEIKKYEEGISDIKTLIDELSPLCPIAHYPFNGDAQDVINNYDGVVMGSTSLTEDRFGNTNQAYDFGGNDTDFIKVDHQIITKYPFSVNSWIKPRNNISGWKTFFAFVKQDPINPNQTVDRIIFGSSFIFSPSSPGDPSDPNIRISVTNDNADPGIYWDIKNNVSYDNTPEQWRMITVVFESESSRKLYIDGNLAIESNVSVPYNPEIDMFLIGRPDLGNPVFNGAIDDVSIFNKALNTNMITRLLENPF